MDCFENISYYEFSPSKTCAYFNDRIDKFRYFYCTTATQNFAEFLLMRGWRRFGYSFFVPTCEGCDKCISIRVLVDEFVLSPRFKRVMNKNASLDIQISRPSISAEKIKLINKYNAVMKTKKGWDYELMSESDYGCQFVDGGDDFSLEICYRIENKLVGVGYIDLGQDSLSAIYFFYDHDYAKQSLGTFNILYQISLAKSYGLKYFYPGYYIKNHYAMGYKKDFTPFERLITPKVKGDITTEPIWVRDTI